MRRILDVILSEKNLPPSRRYPPVGTILRRLGLLRMTFVGGCCVLLLSACGGGSAPLPKIGGGPDSPSGSGAAVSSSNPPPSQPGTSIAGKIAFARDGNVWVYR